MSSPRVSVVMIFLNEERFIAEAIQSVRSQTFTNWELLLVDDGSSDASTGIARDEAARYPNTVQYLEHAGHANRGMSASRNLALAHARGTLVSYIDGDDVWVHEKLEEQVRLLDEHPDVAFVYGPLLLWHSWTGRLEDESKDHLYGLGRHGMHPYLDGVIPPPRLVELLLRDHNFIPGGVLVRRAAIDAVGGYVDEFRTIYEDVVVLVKICLERPVYVSSRCWYKYRRHPDQTTVRERGQRLTNERRFIHWLAGHIAESGVFDRRLNRALRREVFKVTYPRLTDLRRRTQERLETSWPLSRVLWSVRRTARRFATIRRSGRID